MKRTGKLPVPRLTAVITHHSEGPESLGTVSIQDQPDLPTGRRPNHCTACGRRGHNRNNRSKCPGPDAP